jgi:hypothetical protein
MFKRSTPLVVVEDHRFRIEIALFELHRRFDAQNARDSNNRAVGAALLGAGAIVPALLFSNQSAGWTWAASLYVVVGAVFGGLAIRPRKIGEISTSVLRERVLGAANDDAAGVWLFDNTKALIAQREAVLAHRHRLVRGGLMMMVAGVMAVLLAGSPWTMELLVGAIAF